MEHKTIGAIECLPKPDNMIGLSQKLSTTQLHDLQCSLLACSNSLHRLQDSLQTSIDQDQHSDPTLCAYSECLGLLKRETEKIPRLLQSLKGITNTQDNPSAHPPFSPSTAIQGRILQHQQSDQIRRKINNYRSVRSLSTSLYHALAHACQDHPQHLAHIQLRPHHPAPAENETCIEFKMRFSGSEEGPSAVVRSHEAVWLSVQSSIRKHDTSAATSHTWPDRNADASVRGFFDDCEDEAYYPGVSGWRAKDLPNSVFLTTTGLDTDGENIDLSARRSFCKIMSRHDQDTIETLPFHLGYIGAHKPCANGVHRVSFSDHFLTLGKCPPVSLIRILDALFVGPGLDSMLCERVGLAKQLASAMLQFQHTPLLRPSWSGDDIVFFGGLPSQRTGANEALHKPHLNVKIGATFAVDPSSSSSMMASSSVSSMGKGKSPVSQFLSSSASLRNSCLLALAIILIELAYQRPLARCSEMDQNHGRLFPDDIDSGDAALHRARWTAADQLCSGVAARLGHRYKNVVRECLDLCREFQHSQLTEEDFEVFMYIYVVNELENIKRIVVNLDC